MESVQYVGTTKRGTKVSVNPLLLDADFALAIGNVDVHYFAGYTGGYKAVVPALAGKETIEKNHSLMTLPNAEPAVVESNPVREDLEEAGQMTGLRFIVNVVQDERKRIVNSFAGDPITAQRAAIKTVDDLVKVPIKEPADIVIASAGGYPRDINLYQAHKAIENASHAVKDGGTIILVAECGEGFANTKFEDWMTNATSLDEIREKTEQTVRSRRPQGLRPQQDRQTSRDRSRIQQVPCNLHRPQDLPQTSGSAERRLAQAWKGRIDSVDALRDEHSAGNRFMNEDRFVQVSVVGSLNSDAAGPVATLGEERADRPGRKRGRQAWMKLTPQLLLESSGVTSMNQT